MNSCCWRAILFSWALAACAALPDVESLSSAVEPNPVPSVIAARGATLPESKTELLLDQRWGRHAPDLKTRAALEEAATGAPLIAGNKLTLLFDGPQTMEEMLAAISNAHHSINLETYIFDQDSLGLKFAAALIEKQQQGVAVCIIYDSVGTIGVPQAFFERMRDAGVKLVAFNPVNPARLHGNAWKLNNRDHRKILIVDGKLGFTGGINISDTYSRSSLFRSKVQPADRSEVGWRDTHVKIEGPAVAALQWIFVRTWTQQHAQALPEVDFFPPQTDAGDKLVRVLASEPGGDFEIFKAYMLALQAAKKSIHLTSGYFVPDQQTVDALIHAAQRGVDVKVVLPGVTDSALVFHAGHAAYEQLLRGGVQLYHLKLTVLHAKTAVIDASWSTVGSSNIDMRSFMHNSELNIIVPDQAFGHDMETAFAEDLRNSQQITLEQWQQRSIKERLMEWAARIINYWL